MITILTELVKVLMIILLGLYVYESFSVLTKHDEKLRNGIYIKQRIFLFVMHFLGYSILYLATENIIYIFFYIIQVVIYALYLVFFELFFNNGSSLLANNLIAFLMIGMIIIGRLNINHAMRLFVFEICGLIISLFIPKLIEKFEFLENITIIYAAVGIAALLIVFVFAALSYGAKLSIKIGPVSIQPSEFVKISFVFCLASLLKSEITFKKVLITTIVAATHVIILVLSKDLGCALILFIAYTVMIYVSTKNLKYLGIILTGGIAASIFSYFMFSHVQTRVIAWLDPFKVIDNQGYQVCQSLFAIGSGGFLGTGLFKGLPKSIPVVEQDFIFSAISEEMGLIFALFLLLLCISSMILFFNISLQISDTFYKLTAIGLASIYSFQTFLTVGGATKFIPSTGVTFPLVSYGGSSLTSMIILFSIIQGVYILRMKGVNHEKK